MTSPIDLLTRLKAQIERLRQQASAYEDGSAPLLIKNHCAELDRLLTDLAEAVEQDHEAGEHAHKLLVDRCLELEQKLADIGHGDWFRDAAWQTQHDRANAAEQRVQALEAELQALRVQPWQPIETAPKDGNDIFLTDGRWKRAGYWAKRINSWSIDGVGPFTPPTHWLPAPPVGEGKP